MPEPPIAELPPEPFQHFKLYLFAAVSRVIAQAARTLESEEQLLTRFPFLAAYQEELERLGLGELDAEDGAGAWSEAIAAWEEDVTVHLPLRALREAMGLEHDALTLLLAVGLVEEDARFGLLFSALQGTPTLHRPTQGLLNAWWRPPEDRGEVRAWVRRWSRLGLLEVVNPDAPRTEWALHVPGPLWDALRGESHAHLAPGLRHHPLGELQADGPLLIPESLREALARLPPLLRTGELQALLVRGPSHNGRRTLLRAVARELGRGVLEVEGLGKAEDERWRRVGPLATLLHALPVVVLDPAPGETVELPRLEGSDAPLGLVLGRQGGVSGPAVERALTLSLELPTPEERREHWRHGLGGPCASLDSLTTRFRMTRGHIRRVAPLAQAHAALSGRSEVELEDVQEASRALHRQALDTLAVRLSPAGDWNQLAVGTETLLELRNVEARCRHRERLPALVGVRALFQGPSGTGKTLAARILAASLRMDLYRVELSSVVNKYIGETEKNLSRLFSLAEELDVILLFDEGRRSLRAAHRRQLLQRPLCEPGDQLPAPAHRVLRGHPRGHHERGRVHRLRLSAAHGRGGGLPRAGSFRALGPLAAPPAAGTRGGRSLAPRGRGALRPERWTDPQRGAACLAARAGGRSRAGHRAP